jgi:lambda family phage portal protein
MGKKKKSKPQQGQRIYAGAIRNRLNSDWIASSTSADSEIWSSLRTLRDRSRSLCRDNDYAIGAVRTILSNVLGESGIKMQSKVKLLRGDRLNDSLNKTIEALWKDWQNPKYCDVGGRLAWPQLERLALRSVIESGEVLIRKVPYKFADSPVPFALQVIESDQLADTYSQSLRAENGNTIKMGIELNQWERPVAYWVYPYHPGDNYAYATPDKQRFTPIRVPAEEIVHLYLCDRPGQTRGVPWFAAAINRLRHMGGYEEAEIIKARAHACAMGFIQSPDPGSFGDAQADGSKKQLGFEAGTIHTLEPGEVFQGFAPTSPNQGLDPFLRFMLRGVSAGIGVPSDALSMDYSQTTYGGQRAAMLDARDYWGVVQQWLWMSFHQIVFEAWLDAAVVSGALYLPGYEANERQYNHPAWMPRGWSWIDPSKDVAASVTAITNGLSTLGRELAAQGLDFEELVQDRQREVDLLKKAKISVEIYPETMPTPPPADNGQSAAQQPKEGLAPVRSIADGLTPIRPWEGVRAAKKCKAKPCGNACIATSKACLQGLSPAQKKLAQAAGKAMEKGKTGAAVDLPAQATPTAKPAKVPSAASEVTPKTNASAAKLSPEEKLKQDTLNEFTESLIKAKNEEKDAKEKLEKIQAESQLKLQQVQSKVEAATQKFRETSDVVNKINKERLAERKDPVTKKVKSKEELKIIEEKYKKLLEQPKKDEADASNAQQVALMERSKIQKGLKEASDYHHGKAKAVVEIESTINKIKSGQYDFNKVGGDADYVISDKWVDDIEARFGKATTLITKTKTGVQDNDGNEITINYTAAAINGFEFAKSVTMDGDKVNKAAIDFINKKGSGRVYEISWFPSETPSYRSANLEAEKIKIARTAIKGWKEDILPKLKDGDIVQNMPLGGAQGARARAYERSGYSKVHANGYQFAIVEGGKLKPIQFHEFNDSNDTSN